MEIKDQKRSIAYSPPALLFNQHLETIFPALVRKVKGIAYRRERIFTPDEDFLDLDWLEQNSDQLVIISHGLEGNTQRAYIKGMARAFFNENFDVLTWNFRGCSEELNWQLRFYHSGATDDLDLVVKHAASTNRYKAIYLIGFSLGGNLTLKYLGEQGNKLNPLVQKGVTFSVPLDLHASCKVISQYTLYSRRFVRSLKKKVIEKSKLRPELSIKGIGKIKTLLEFDDAYTAPLHHFHGAVDYYDKCSSIHFIEGIDVPTLIVNAENDPFLEHAINQNPVLHRNPHVQFETTTHGGHVGFTLFNQNGLYWSELRALNFILGQHV